MSIDIDKAIKDTEQKIVRRRQHRAVKFPSQAEFRKSVLSNHVWEEADTEIQFHQSIARDENVPLETRMKASATVLAYLMGPPNATTKATEKSTNTVQVQINQQQQADAKPMRAVIEPRISVNGQ